MTDPIPEEPSQKSDGAVEPVNRIYVGCNRAETVDGVTGERFEVRLRKQLTRGD